MIRKLMASSAMIALMTAGSMGLAQAQDTTVQQDQPAMQQPAAGGDAQMQTGGDAQMQTEAGATSEMTTGEANPTLQPEQPTLATAFIGKSVYSSQDPEADNIGNVNDLIVSDDGSITHAVIGVGGFLGIGEKNVAVPFDELQVAEGEGDIRLIYASTREDLEAAEEFDRTAYDPSARNQEAQNMAAGGATGMSTAPQTGMAADPAAGGMAATGDAQADQEMAGTGETAEVVTEEQTAETDVTQEPAAPVTTAQTGDAGTAVEGETAAEGEMAAGGEAAETGFSTYDAAALRASTLMGREIYGQEGDSIGEVSDLVLQPDGGTRAALVDVGGFLGVGEKQVAIPFSEIQVQQGQDGEEPRLTIAMSREQLEQQTAYEAPEQTADTGTMAPAGETAGQTADGTMANDGTVAVDQNQTAMQGDVAAGGAQMASQELSADELLGQAVYGANDDDLGEIDDLVFTPEGSIEAVVIDVGGFLGLGEKPVAVQYDSLNVQKDGNGETRISINATEEQLQNAPTYDDETNTVQ